MHSREIMTLIIFAVIFVTALAKGWQGVALAFGIYTLLLGCKLAGV